MAGTIHEISVGRAGELLACGIIEAMGYRTVLCQQRSFDVLLMDDDVHHYRVEVKTCSTERQDRNRRAKRYSFTTATGSGAKTSLNPDAVDILCLVALDIRKVYFMAVADCPAVRTNRTKEVFMENDEAGQLAEVIKRVEELKCGKHLLGQ